MILQPVQNCVLRMDDVLIWLIEVAKKMHNLTYCCVENMKKKKNGANL